MTFIILEVMKNENEKSNNEVKNPWVLSIRVLLLGFYEFFNN